MDTDPPPSAGEDAVRTAVYIDGSFLRHQLEESGREHTPEAVGRLAAACAGPDGRLARVNYYGSDPYASPITLPVSGRFREPPHRDTRLLARLAPLPHFSVHAGRMEFRGFLPRQVLAASASPSDSDYRPDFKEKEVDGMLIADLVRDAVRGTYGRAVVVTGDTDLVPALVLARREGVEVVMARLPGHDLADRLLEHSDQVRDIAWPGDEGEPGEITADLPLEDPGDGGGEGARPGEEEEREEEPAALPSLGDMAKGPVVRIDAEEGAVLRLGPGLEGAILPSELDWKRRRADLAEALGDAGEVEAKVVGIDAGRRMAKLSVKRTGPDPWDGIDSVYPEGREVRGRVTGDTDGGDSIVVLEEGFEGGVPSLGIPPPLRRGEGEDPVGFRVTGIDREARLVRLEPVEPYDGSGEEPGEGPAPGQGAGAGHAGEDEPASALIGRVVTGTVKNTTEYGAFIDLGGGRTGLVHNTHLSWRRVRHASEFVSPGEKVDVKVLDVSGDGTRISLGIKQLEEEAWERAERECPPGTRVAGQVTHVSASWALVKLEQGITAFLHRNDLAWGPPPPIGEALSVGGDVEAVVLEMDPASRRAKIGVRQLGQNPGANIESDYPPGSRATGRVTGVEDDWALLEMAPGITGFLHRSDLAWERPPPVGEALSVGDEVEAVVLDVNPRMNRVKLGVRQLERDPWATAERDYPPGRRVSGRVSSVRDDWAFVDLEPGLAGMLHIADFAWERPASLTDAVSEGDEIGVMVLSVSQGRRRMRLGAKQLEWDPWEHAGEVAEGDSVTGTVTHIGRSGVYIRLENGLEGMLPLGEETARLGNTARKALKDGTPLRLRVLSVDRERRHIGLGLAEPPDGDAGPLEPGRRVTGKVTGIGVHQDNGEWRKAQGIAGAVSVGDDIEAVVVGVDAEKRRASLRVNRLEPDPWDRIGETHPPGRRATVTVTEVTPEGVAVRVGAGIDGLVPASELDWVDRDADPGEHAEAGDDIEAEVLSADRQGRRLLLSLKRCKDNPWEEFAAAHPVNSVVSGTVRAAGEDGLVVDLAGGLHGLVRPDDLPNGKGDGQVPRQLPPGSGIDAVVLEADPAEARILLGVRQLASVAFDRYIEGNPLGGIVSGKITDVTPERAEVDLDEHVTGVLPADEVPRAEHDQLTDVVQAGEEMDFVFLKIDWGSLRPVLSLTRAMGEGQAPGEGAEEGR